MGKKSTPAAPDYTAAAEKTAASNQQAQTTADWANRPDQTDMYGNKTSWTSSAQVDPATGQNMTKWAQSTQLSPQQQAAMDQQQGIQKGMMDTAGGLLGAAQGAVGQPFNPQMQNWGQAPQGGGLQAGNINPGQFQSSGAGQGIMSGLDTGSLGAMPQADAAERQRIEGALFDRMRPQHEEAQAGLEGKLANMGLTRGSTAWNRESQRLGDQQSRERFNALEMGGQEQQRLFGMGMQGRQQGFNELSTAGQFQNAAQNQRFGQGMQQDAQNFDQQRMAAGQNFDQQRAAQGMNFDQGMQGANYNNALRQNQLQEQLAMRNQPLNELNAYMTGQQVQAPQFQGFGPSRSAGGADYSGAAGQQYNSSLDAYNAKQQQRQGLMSGLGGLASTGMMMSDRRLKRDIAPAGTSPSGVPYYTYRYVWGWRRHLGVMADEVAKICPSAVSRHWSGFLQVDYSRVT